MKNAKTYEKKFKKLLSNLPKAPDLPSYEDPVEIMVLAILEADASQAEAKKAYSQLLEEFVDLNEVRVAPHKEIIESLGKDFPRAREKANQLVNSLGNLYEKTFDVKLAHAADMPKRQLRRYLSELDLSTYAEACVSLMCFDAHAIPVDTNLLESLKIDKMIHPEADKPDLQGFLERIISHKNALAAHQELRSFVASHQKALDKMHQEQYEAHQEKVRQAEEKAKAAAEADERARLEARTAGSGSEKAAPPSGKKSKKSGKGKKATSGKSDSQPDGAKNKTQADKKDTGKKATAKGKSAKPKGTKSSAGKKSTKASKKKTSKKAASGKTRSVRSKSSSKSKADKKAADKSPSKSAAKSSKKASKKTAEKTAKKSSKKKAKKKATKASSQSAGKSTTKKTSKKTSKTKRKKSS